MIAPGSSKKTGQTDEQAEQCAREDSSPAVHRFVWGFGVIMVIIAGGGFLFKLVEFSIAFMGDHPMNFSILPVMTYLVVAAGYLCLFMWAYLTGQFKNIESPKYRMLELQQEIDAAEAADAAGTSQG